jgi:sulfur carrier protein
LRVLVNGDSVQIKDGATVGDLVAELNLKPERLAIEVNRKVLRKSEWGSTSLTGGDKIEIVHLVGGGAQSSADRHVPPRTSRSCRRGA